MSNVSLNLARKWRSKNFDQIIGQELCIRMLKNSLYLDQYFPVYLFAGQRGCGKTSTARVFAAALNCEQLKNFQAKPKDNTVPCLACKSCTAMMAGRHPDFFEIDAASHTGVDNVRQIIDSSLLLPVMGRKKIYLIDEAHMLSKAAFNALLKILEEPPESVLFILATTDTQKIIDTVKSRCFQLFFRPIDNNSLYKHLVYICEKESIAFDEKGLRLIIKETQGSARDALNVLEQVRFSSSSISKESVLQVLGHIDDDQIVHLLSCVLTKKPDELLSFMRDIKLELFAPEYVWQRLIALARAALWIKHGVEPQQFQQYHGEIKRMVSRCSWQHLSEILAALFSHEPTFLRTTVKHGLIEMVLLQLCKKNGNGSTPQGAAMLSSSQPAEFQECDEEDLELEENEEEEEEESDDSLLGKWKTFAKSLDSLNDPLMSSVLRQGTATSFDVQTGVVAVSFLKKLTFFNDTLEQARGQWLPLLQAVFGAHASLSVNFDAEGELKKIERPKPHAMPAQAPQQRSAQQATAQRAPFRQQRRAAQSPSVRENKLDISDAQLWPKAHMLLSHFPGAVTEIMQERHG